MINKITKYIYLLTLFTIIFYSRTNHLSPWPENPVSLQFAVKTSFSILIVSFLCATANTLSTIFIYLYAKKTINKSAAFFIALAFAFSPTNWLSATTANPTQIYLFIFLLAISLLPQNNLNLKPHFFFYPLVIIAVILLFQTSFPLVKARKNITPPSILATLFIRQAFKPESIILTTTSTYDQFKYYLPEFTNYQSLPDNIESLYLASDHPINQESAKNYTYLNTIEFSNSLETFAQLPKTRLYLYKKTQ